MNNQVKEPRQVKQLKLNDIKLKKETLKKEYQEMLEELNISQEQINDPENFFLPIWEVLKKEKEKINEQINRDLDGIKDINKLKKTFSERGSIQPHWIFVR